MQQDDDVPLTDRQLQALAIASALLDQMGIAGALRHIREGKAGLIGTDDEMIRYIAGLMK